MHTNTLAHILTQYEFTVMEDGAVGIAGQQVVRLAAEINKETKKRQLLIAKQLFFPKTNAIGLSVTTKILIKMTFWSTSMK